MSDQEINKLHYFEIMDRTSVIIDSIEDVLIANPAMTPEMKNDCRNAQVLLLKVYNLSGSKFRHFGEDND